MTATTQRSSYGQGSTSSSAADGEVKSTSTTHYAYRLIRDEDGNVTGKDFINNLQIFENEGKFGKFLKVRVTGPIPQDDLFVAKKRDKSAA